VPTIGFCTPSLSNAVTESPSNASQGLWAGFFFGVNLEISPAKGKENQDMKKF
jgi:hypothetical protein